MRLPQPLEGCTSRQRLTNGPLDAGICIDYPRGPLRIADSTSLPVLSAGWAMEDVADFNAS